MKYEKLTSEQLGEASAAIRERVAATRERQRARVARSSGGTALLTNADMGAAEIRQWCVLDSAGQSLMRTAMRQLQLSARAYHRVLKLARTIAHQASVLVQLGLIDDSALPVAGAESARKLLDLSLPSNTLIERAKLA